MRGGGASQVLYVSKTGTGREFLSKSFWSCVVELRKAFRVLIPCSDTERRGEASENGRQAFGANTESHQPERPQLLRFLAAAVCSQVFFSAPGEAPQGCQQPSHFRIRAKMRQHKGLLCGQISQASSEEKGIFQVLLW